MRRPCCRRCWLPRWPSSSRHSAPAPPRRSRARVHRSRWRLPSQPSPPEKTEGRRDAAPPAAASILRAGTPLRPTPEAAERDAQPIPPAAKKPMTPQDKERALRLMKKGDEELAQGDVASARLLYERA